MGTERESITKEVGSRIRYARKSRGMSMDELAQAIYKTRFCHLQIRKWPDIRGYRHALRHCQCPEDQHL